MLRKLLSTVLLCVVVTSAALADSTIARLPPASVLDGTETLYGVQSGGDRKITASQFAAYIQAFLINTGIFNPVTLRLYGAVGDGFSDDRAALLAADAAAQAVGLPVVIERSTFIGSSVTVGSKIEFRAGARLKWAGTTTLTLNGGVQASGQQQIFDYPTTATLVLAGTGTTSLDWLYGPRDGTLDVSKLGNDLIASAPDNGREIRHEFGRLLIGSVLVNGAKNGIHLTCPGGPAYRSNIEYQKAPPAGIGAQTEYPGNGPALLLGRGVPVVFSNPAYSTALTDAGYRVSGMGVQGCTFIASNQRTALSTGISSVGATDATYIKDSSFINFDLAGLISNADTPTISGTVSNEGPYNWKITNSFNIRFANNDLGCQPTGEGLHVENSTYLELVGNTSYPDCAVNLSLNNVGYVRSTGNTWNSRFTGMIYLNGVFSSRFDDLIHVGNFLNPSNWTDQKSQWASQNYDPRSRDTLYGVIHVESSTDSDFSGTLIDSQMPANSVLVRNVSGDRNSYNFIKTSGAASNQKIVQDAGNDNQVVGSVLAGEWMKNGGTAYFQARGTAN